MKFVLRYYSVFVLPGWILNKLSYFFSCNNASFVVSSVFLLFLFKQGFILRKYECLHQEYDFFFFFEANFRSLAKPVICQWHQWQVCFFKEETTSEVWAQRIAWHLSPCKKQTNKQKRIVSEFRIEAYLYLLISRQKNSFFKTEALRMFTDHRRNCNKEINMHDPFSCSTTRLHC